jgi:hypothetical protein
VVYNTGGCIIVNIVKVAERNSIYLHRRACTRVEFFLNLQVVSR